MMLRKKNNKNKTDKQQKKELAKAEKNKRKAKTRLASAKTPEKEEAIKEITFAMRLFRGVIAATAILVSGWAILDAMEKNITESRKPFSVVRYDAILEAPPCYVPSTVSRKIAATSLPPNVDFDDPQLCEKVSRIVLNNPIVRKVCEVKKIRMTDNCRIGKIYIKAEYRQPYAIVENDAGNKYYVDKEGYRLATENAAKYYSRLQKTSYVSFEEIPPRSDARRIHYIIIDGVKGLPPKVNEKWDAPDLVDGLRLVKLFRTRKYGDQITKVDVRNFNNRVSKCDPALCLTAYDKGRDGIETSIRFGRFPRKRDWVVRPEVKMQNLDEYVHENDGQLAGIHEWIELFHDDLHYPVVRHERR